MNAPSPHIPGSPAIAMAARPAAEIARWIAAALIVLTLLAAGVLWWRRLAGALSEPLEPLALLGFGLSATLMAAAAGMAWRHVPAGGRPTAGRWLALALISVGLPGSVLALSVPGTSGAALLGVWAAIAGEELWAWWPALRTRLVWRWLRQRGRESLSMSAGQAADVRNTLSPTWKTTPEPLGVVTPRVPSDVPPAGDVVQQLTRSRAADGSESVAGWLRVPLAVGQRSANVHVAFCPPFAHTPRLEVEQAEGPAARVKTAQLLPYGVRFDLKLDHPLESAAAVLLQFSATAAEGATGHAAEGGSQLPGKDGA